MADLVSAGVQIKEKDLTTTVQNEPTSIGAIAIVASQGYADTVITVGSEDELVEQFGKPSGTNFEYWFSAANFLGYSNQLKVVRCIQTGMLNATGAGAGLLIPNTTAYQVGDGTYGPYSGGQASVMGSFGARSPGAWGNNLQVAYCTSTNAYSQANVTNCATAGNAAGDTTMTVADGTTLNVGDVITFGSSATGANAHNLAIAAAERGQKYKISAISTNLITFARYPTVNATGLYSAIDGSSTVVDVNRFWEFWDQFDKAPGTSQFAADRGGSADEMHIIVRDEDGGITGLAGTVLELYDAVSKGSDALTEEGNVNYYVDVLYNNSEYIYWLDHPANSGSTWGTTVVGTTFTAATADPASESMANGADGSTVTNGQRQLAYDHFNDADTEDLNLIIGCLLYTSPSPRDATLSRMPSCA